MSYRASFCGNVASIFFLLSIYCERSIFSQALVRWRSAKGLKWEIEKEGKNFPSSYILHSVCIIQLHSRGSWLVIFLILSLLQSFCIRLELSSIFSSIFSSINMVEATRIVRRKRDDLFSSIVHIFACSVLNINTSAKGDDAKRKMGDPLTVHWSHCLPATWGLHWHWPVTMSQVELIEPTGLHRHPENINSFIYRNPVIRVSVRWGTWLENMAISKTNSRPW